MLTGPRTQSRLMLPLDTVLPGGYNDDMTAKFHVSMPDAIHAELSATARHLRMSRSEYITRAVQEALRRDSAELRKEEAERVYQEIAEGDEDIGLRTWVELPDGLEDLP